MLKIERFVDTNVVQPPLCCNHFNRIIVIHEAGRSWEVSSSVLLTIIETTGNFDKHTVRVRYIINHFFSAFKTKIERWNFNSIWFFSSPSFSYLFYNWNTQPNHFQCVKIRAFLSIEFSIYDSNLCAPIYWIPIEPEPERKKIQ